jgi:hypothetical protein
MKIKSLEIYLFSLPMEKSEIIDLILEGIPKVLKIIPAHQV